jgi:hypothetical protein
VRHRTADLPRIRRIQRNCISTTTLCLLCRR